MIKKIGHQITRIRKSKDLTQANMAEELGMTTSAYSKIERGDTNPPINRLLEIAKVLEVDVADFFADPSMTTKDEPAKYGYATKEEVENLSKLVNSLIKEIERLRQDLPQLKHLQKKSKTPKG